MDWQELERKLRDFGEQLGTTAQAWEASLRKRWRILIAVLVLAALGVALIKQHKAVSGAVVVTPYPHELARVTFAAAGDVIPHDAVRQAAAAAGEGEQGWAALFSNVADVFDEADFGFVNLETPVAPDHSHGTKAFMFDAPVVLPEALKASGIKIVSFANNHVMDQGWPGFAESLDHLKQVGLLVVGTSDNSATAWQPVITQANGIKVGWLGMTRWLNGNRNPDKADQPHVNFFPYPGEAGGAPGADEATVLAAVKAARAQCDLLVVSIHWGIEYATAPRPEDIDLAHKIMDAGASVILGSHPHVLQPIETYRTQDGRTTVIFYSLGNFLSNQSRTYIDGLNPDSNGEPRDELIALFSAVRNDYGPAGIRVELGHLGVLPVWEENNRNDLAAGRTKTPVIRPILIDREIPVLQTRLDELNKLASQGNTAASQQANAGLTDEQKKEFIEVTEEAEAFDRPAGADSGARRQRICRGAPGLAGEIPIAHDRSPALKGHDFGRALGGPIWARL